MSQPTDNTTQQNELLSNLNARLTELAESETSVTVLCVYNDNRMSGFDEVQTPLRYYQAHQHLLFQIHPGANGTQGPVRVREISTQRCVCASTNDQMVFRLKGL